MDGRPIGVFDSGLGGLTALRELTALLPGEDFIYFGDTGRVPYGGRSRETIIQYARQDVAFLRRFSPKAVVVACGTVSTTAMEVLRAENPALPIFGVTVPACEAAAEATKNGRIGLIGTRASIRSGAYERTLAGLRPGLRVTARSCPLFVPLVENGRYRKGDVVAETVAEEYLAPLREEGVDSLILGCTHYPLLREVIAGVMGPEVALVDAGAQAARRVARWLEENGLCAAAGRTGTQRFFVSDDAGDFAQAAARFLGTEERCAVERISLNELDVSAQT